MSARLIHGDCLAVLPTLEPGSVGMVLADLPYGTTQNKWDSVIPLDALWAELLRVAKPSAALVFTASQPFTSVLVMSRPALFRHEWVWIKNRGSNFANTVREPFKEHEAVLVFSRGGWTYNKQMQPRTGGGIGLVGKVQDRVTRTSNYGAVGGVYGRELPELRVPSSWQKFNTDVGLHPTQKPVALGEYLILTYTNPGDTVLDPTMGSGSFGVAALNTDRRFVGIERDADYFAIAGKRLADAEARSAMPLLAALAAE